MNPRRLLSSLRLPSLFAAAVLAGAMLASSASAAEPGPKPDWSGSEYHPPKLELPAWRAEYWIYIDTILLVAALGLAAYLTHRARTCRGLYWLAVGSLVYFGFIRHGCVCPIGAIQNVTLAIVNWDYKLPAVVAIFFALPLLTALLFGRVFCAAVCPLGAVQEVTLLKPVRVPVWLEHSLGLLPYLYLGLAVLSAAMGSRFLICEYDPYVSFFRMDGPFSILIFGAALLILGFFVGRPYCRFLCPYGALLRLTAAWTWIKVKIYPTECIQCRLCEDSCPYEAILPMTPEQGAKEKRAQARRRLAYTLLLLPLITALFALLGHLSAPALARLDSRVVLSDLLREQGGIMLKDERVEVEALRRTGTKAETVYAEAEVVLAQYRFGAIWLGTFIGLALGLKLARLGLQRRRTTYEPDQGRCVACARCYLHCPQELVRLGRIGEGTLPTAAEDSPRGG